jgi:hypothetical protein
MKCEGGAPPRHKPFPIRRGRGVPCAGQMTTPQPCPPTPLRGHRRAGTPHCVLSLPARGGSSTLGFQLAGTSSYNAPIWACVARGGISASTQCGAPTATPADVIALYRPSVASGSWDEMVQGMKRLTFYATSTCLPPREHLPYQLNGTGGITARPPPALSVYTTS